MDRDRIADTDYIALADAGLQGKLPRVLVVAPGLMSRGGIASVVRLHMGMPVWREMNCDLLSTHDDRNALHKLFAALSSYILVLFKAVPVDIVHLHVAGQVSLMRKLPIATLARLYGKTLIVHVHASSPESLFQATPNWAVQSVLGNADCIVALSNSWANIIRDRVSGVCVTVIPNPVLDSSTPDRQPQRKRVVLFAGKLEPRKGYMTLLQAAQIILKQHPDMQFWFAGHGDLDRALAEAGRLGISSSVRLLGWTEAGDLVRLYRESCVFCLPSHNEGVPMSVLEAMSHGCPVVCTRVGGLSEVVIDGENGLFATVGDAESTAEKILRLVDDPAFANSIAAAAARSVQASCGTDIVGKHLRQLYWAYYSRRLAEKDFAGRKAR
jgi:glycosyltransferase involved in cell wall biosynthesis